jgi:rsbT antagonist protein RsbS
VEPFSIFSLGDCLLVSIQEEIDDQSLESLIGLLGKKVVAKRARAVIIDLHDVEIVDTFLAEHIAGLVSFLHLLKAKVMVAGLQVPVVLTLIDFDIRLKGIEFALDVEQALKKLNG